MKELPPRLTLVREVARERLGGSVATLVVIAGVKDRSSLMAVMPLHVTPTHGVPRQGPEPRTHEERAGGLPRSLLKTMRATSW